MQTRIIFTIHFERRLSRNQSAPPQRRCYPAGPRVCRENEERRCQAQRPLRAACGRHPSRIISEHAQPEAAQVDAAARHARARRRSHARPQRRLVRSLEDERRERRPGLVGHVPRRLIPPERERSRVHLRHTEGCVRARPPRREGDARVLLNADADERAEGGATRRPARKETRVCDVERGRRSGAVSGGPENVAGVHDPRRARRGVTHRVRESR
jgi:hypothetical protein